MYIETPVFYEPRRIEAVMSLEDVWHDVKLLLDEIEKQDCRIAELEAKIFQAEGKSDDKAE